MKQSPVKSLASLISDDVHRFATRPFPQPARSRKTFPPELSFIKVYLSDTTHTSVCCVTVKNNSNGGRGKGG